MAAQEPRKRGGGRWMQHGAPLETFSRLACQSEMALAIASLGLEHAANAKSAKDEHGDAYLG